VVVRYEVDETSPEDTLADALFCPDGTGACYQILSKPIAARQPQNSATGTQQSTAAAATSGCCEHCQHHQSE